MKRIGMLAVLALASVVGLSAQDKGAAAKKAPAAAAKDAKAAATAKVLDINSAKTEELEALPAIGKAKAAKIVAGRPFKGKNELVTKKILTEAEYEKVKDLIIAKQK